MTSLYLPTGSAGLGYDRTAPRGLASLHLGLRARLRSSFRQSTVYSELRGTIDDVPHQKWVYTQVKSMPAFLYTQLPLGASEYSSRFRLRSNWQSPWEPSPRVVSPQRCATRVHTCDVRVPQPDTNVQGTKAKNCTGANAATLSVRSTPARAARCWSAATRHTFPAFCWTGRQHLRRLAQVSPSTPMCCVSRPRSSATSTSASRILAVVTET